MKYHPLDIQYMLKRAELLVDTREQNTPVYQQRLQAIGLPYTRVKLDVGDYSIQTTDDAGNIIKANTSIERKMNLDELCACFTSGRARFEREFQRASANNTKIWLLVEESSWAQLLHKQYRSLMHPNALLGSMIDWAVRYDISIVLCRAADAPTLIKNILLKALKKELGVRNDGNT